MIVHLLSKNIKIFFVKIGMKLPFTLKKKCKHFLKFKSLKLFFYPPKSMYLAMECFLCVLTPIQL